MSAAVSEDSITATPFWLLPAEDPPEIPETEMYTLHPDKAGADIWYEQGAYQEDDEGHKIPLDFNRIYDLLADPYAFVSMCQIDLEGGGMSYVPLSRFQKWLLYGIHTDRWVIVDKYRQAYMTTVSVLWLLRDCMYLKGTKGVLIACDDKTAEDAFERVLYAYEHLPHAVRVPLRKGHRGSIREIKFVHGGSIKIVTASGRSPAVGRGLSRIVVTEWGETIWQTRAAINLFPTIYKRPHGRLILESTPGRAGSHHQAMWFAALDAAQDVIDKHDINVRPVRDDIAIDEEDDTVGSWASWEKQHPDVAMILAKATLDGMKHGQILLKAPRYRPLFLAWWQDPSTRAVLPRDFVPTAEEVALINTCPGIALENLAFRRQAIKQFFNEDSRLFDAKYPPDPWSGWLGAYAPRLPQDAIKRLLNRAIPESAIPYDEVARCHVLEEPVEGDTYILTADPNAYGQPDGDPSALHVWHAADWREVAFWDGREDPDIFAKRIWDVSHYFGRPKTAPTPDDTAIPDTHPSMSHAVLPVSIRGLRRGQRPRAAGYRPCTVFVESNAEGCIAALRALGHPALYWDDRHHPGWRASEKTLRAAEADLALALNEGDIDIRSLGTLKQLLLYDGTQRSRRIKDDSGRTHHFDRARSVVIAAAVLRFREHAPRNRRKAAGLIDDADSVHGFVGGDETEIVPQDFDMERLIAEAQRLEDEGFTVEICPITRAVYASKPDMTHDQIWPGPGAKTDPRIPFSQRR